MELKIKIYNIESPSHSKRLLLNVLVYLVVIFSLGPAVAHNKVVVIPMFDDEKLEDVDPQLEIEPFVKIQKDETSLSDYSFANGVTKDLITGLEWQQVDSDVSYTFDEADEYCANLALDDKMNWRLPSVKELLSIVDFGSYGPAANETAFTTPFAVSYWAGDEPISLAGRRFRIAFYRGSISTYSVENSNNVRCVRSNGRSPFINVFYDNNDGTITDRASGLIWQKGDDAQTHKQAEAISYCDSLILGDKTDWRLPDLKELVSIVDYREFGPAVDPIIFPDIISSVYWSNLTDALSPNVGQRVEFGYGTTDLFSGDGAAFVRCVH